KGLVREETQRMINFTNGSDANSAVQSSAANIANKQKKKKSKKDSKNKGNCHRCGEPGHFAKECRGKLKGDNDEDKRDGFSKGEKAKDFGGLAYCFQAAANPAIPVDPDLWVFDSGATDFMHPDRKLFIDYGPLKIPKHIHGTGEHSLIAIGTGNVGINSDDGKHRRRIEDVLHV